MDVKAALNDKGTLVVFLVVMALIVSAAVGGYIWYKKVKDKSEDQPKVTTEIESFAYPISGTISKVIEMPEKIEEKNNKQMSVSFWFYMKQFDRTNTSNKHILHIADDEKTDDPYAWGMFAELIGGTNSIRIGFPSTDSLEKESSTLLGNKSTDGNAKKEYLAASRGIIIDYIPEDRWVFISVVQNNVNKTIKAYVDGQLVKTREPKDSIKILSSTVTVPTRFDKVDCPGSKKNIFTGVYGSGSQGFNGLISSLRFHSWEMNLNEVRKIYRLGPISNIFARLGLPAYVLQSPIYDRTNVRHDYGAVEDE